jgi:hypothetical protein
MTYTDYYAGAVVIPKGTLLGSFFLVVVKGRLLLQENMIPHLSCVGDKDFGQQGRKEYKHDIIAEVESQVAQISKDELEKAIGGSVEKIKMQNEVEKIMATVPLFKDLETDKISLLVQ